jgi:CCR4-NOT transcriptional complex subunit CAF120
MGQGQRPEFFGHSRNNSSLGHSRNNSSLDLLQKPISHSRNNSSLDLLQKPISRPGSRGAGATLGGAGGDQLTNLSARDHEHLSRITGGPLINLVAGNRAGANTPTGGLVGTIDVREQEKRWVKQGINNQAVQHAINQRQVHGQYPPLPPPQGQLPPLPLQAQQYQQEYAGPFAGQQQGYAVGHGGWTAQNQPQRAQTPEMLGYRERVQQQQQFYPGQGQGQGHGRGGGGQQQYRG